MIPTIPGARLQIEQGACAPAENQQEMKTQLQEFLFVSILIGAICISGDVLELNKGTAPKDKHAGGNAGANHFHTSAGIEVVSRKETFTWTFTASKTAAAASAAPASCPAPAGSSTEPVGAPLLVRLMDSVASTFSSKLTTRFEYARNADWNWADATISASRASPMLFHIVFG